MDEIRNGWFSEISTLWPGQCFSLKVEKILYEEKSEFQDIKIFKSANHGPVLVLDGIIQCTEKDEFAYQEMMSFLPLCVHPNPETVLIVGGGDGGVAREVNKHPNVKKFYQVEIDNKVIEASKKFLPFMAKGFNSPKLTLHVGDGFEFMKQHKHEFDVIITDSSDPIGPATNLFTENYFGYLKNALKPGGVICCQGGTIWTELDFVKQTVDNCKKHFSNVKYANGSVPTYPNGQIGYLVASLDSELDLTKPSLKFSSEELDSMQLKYYTSEVHSAAFALPHFAKKVLNV